jgi:hypothetical protein
LANIATPQQGFALSGWIDQSMIERGRTMNAVTPTIEIPCFILSRQIGYVVEQLEHPTTPSARQQLEAQLASLERLYETQCEPKAKDAQQAAPAGVQASMRFADGYLFLNVLNAAAEEVTVIFGGNDGVLIYIDGRGVIHKLPPEGPGDPEIRQAVTSIVKAVNVMSGAVAVGAAG